MNITKIITLAATVATFAVGTAQAQEAPVIQIDTVGVNFSNPASVELLRSQIKRAAKQVCGVGKDSELNLRMKAHECFSSNVANAGSKIEQRVASAPTKPSNDTLAINTVTTK